MLSYTNDIYFCSILTWIQQHHSNYEGSATIYGCTLAKCQPLYISNGGLRYDMSIVFSLNCMGT